MVAFLLNLSKAYSVYLASFTLILLRFVNSKLLISIAKKLRFDSRSVWEFERLNNIVKSKYAIFYIKLYYFFTPVGKGMAWSCAMESTYRIFNLISLDLKGQNNIIRKYITLEAEYISRNIESHSNNNHILFNYIGLVIADEIYGLFDGVYHDLLFDEISKQFNKDGSNFEASTAYHLLSLEAVLLTAKLIPKLEDEIYSSFNVKDALSFVSHIKSESGIFLIGDNDGSNCIANFHINCDREATKKNFQLRNIYELSKNLHYCNLPEKLFSDFGLYSYRSSFYHFLLSNPKHGQRGRSGHNHNDCNSICLNVLGKDFIVDPGVFLYSVYRDSQRKIVNHSSSYILDNNGNIIEPEIFNSSFSLSSNTVRDLTIVDNGVSSSYSLNWNSLNFKLIREVKFNLDSIDIFDQFTEGSDIARLGFTLCLAVGVEVFETGDGFKLVKGSTSISIIFEDVFSIKSDYGFYFPEYGELSRARRIIVKSKGNKLNWKILIDQ